MGRAFFSSSRSAPAVKSEPPPPLNPMYEKWSITNNFDPDSDEFWDNVCEEKFINIEVDSPAEAQSMPELLHEDPESSSSSSESGDTDRGSPMAVGSDDPAAMVANVYVPLTHIWERIESEPWNYVPSETDRADATVSDLREQLTMANRANVTVADLREQLAITNRASASTASVDTNMSELVPDTPPSSSRYMYADPSPSPAPSVTPRIYHWGRSSVSTTPPSPTRTSSNAGPLTNATARRSLTRIARIRVQGFST